MNILLLSRYGRLGASSRVRFYQYIPYLEAHGIRITVSPLLDDDYLQRLYAQQGRPAFSVIRSYARRFARLIDTSGYDLLWIEKELFPFLPSWVETLLHARGTPSVVDYDDAIFHGYDQHPRKLVRTLLGGKIGRVMQGAALVIAGNGYLAEYARSAGARRVETLPSVVDIDRYRPEPANINRVFTIGWIGSPSTTGYLKQIGPALADVCRNGRARLVLVGAGDISLPGVPLEIRPWSEETEVSAIQSFDTGIMPLPDTPWERGKCGYKLIQCMACGLPVVAAPIGVNRQIVEHGINGFHAEDLDDWTRALTELRDNPEKRRVMGQAAREKVVAEYSLQANGPRLLGMLQRALQGGR
ncbi:MAG: glycosyltransferase family 4 protein [Geobacteraceae bacterium]|nr:glycosyltransferase family 4 protein [Geobacteraceae bacterium]